MTDFEDPQPAVRTPGHDDCSLCGGDRGAGLLCDHFHELVDLYAAVTLDGAIFE